MQVLLMRTCLSDAIAPKVWKATRRALERAGVDVKVPRGQTCCGQPAWNSGHPDQARAVARHTIKVFAGTEEVVVPSGSCAGMVIHSYPELFKGEPDEAEALDLAARTIEFTQFLAKHDLNPRAKPCGAVTVHDSCHMLRMLGDDTSARAALDMVPGLEVREMANADQCCGFGGTFALNYPELSGRLGDQKAHDAMNSGAPEVVACDLGCLMHIAGRAHRTGIPIRARHISEVLGS
jgi:L-lactate dehydrogenase complex protein LldE